MGAEQADAIGDLFVIGHHHPALADGRFLFEKKL